jgi:tetratricopeptide (TPR) repeat protein
MLSKARLAIIAGYLALGISTGLSAAEDRQNLLLITIDTLRADFLSCNGSEIVETPNLDRLAANGVNFTRARSPVPLTLPAHASILTGDASVDPKDKMGIWNQIQMGLFLSGRGNNTGALDILTKAVTSEPDMPILYDYIGSCYMRLGQYSEAGRVYHQALERGIDSADIHVNLGVIHYRRGDLEKAERELQKALALNAHSVQAHYRLADVYRDFMRLAGEEEYARERRQAAAAIERLQQ